MKASEFDRIFDEGKEDILHLFDLTKARRPNRELKSVSIDLPNGMIEKLDCEARRLGVTRDALVKLWLADKLDRPA
jgi:hypothetical protein